jgi:integrase
MRATTRIQGRFVSTCGLKKITGAPGSRYQLVIVDQTGHPVSHLMEWCRLRQKQPGTDSTRRTYLNFLLPFMGYLLKKGVKWNSEPESIRARIQMFLREEVSCFVARDQDADGYRVQLTGNSPLAQSSLQVFFAALRDFYLIMQDAGLYAYENPMYSEVLRKWKRERMRQIANAGAPDHAGIRGESWEQTWQNPTAFFRIKRKLPWKPGLAQESALVLRRVRTALLSMIKQAPTQRDRLVLLLLHQTGARISEILGLTAGGWRKAHHATRAMVTNKGSMGREEKTIYFTPEIERALVLYIRTERARFDPQGRKRLEQLADHEPIFLTRRGTPYTRSSWYYHWNRLLAVVPSDEHTKALGQVLFTPHDTRHLYVSWTLRQMKQRYATNAEKLETLRSALQQRMGWRSSLTITCYDQSESDRERLEVFDAFLQELELHAAEPVSSPPTALSCVKNSTNEKTNEEVCPVVPQQSQPFVSSMTPFISGAPRDSSDLSFWKDEA